MHTHFDDNDWQAAAARYRASVALPDALLVAGLDDVRTCLSKEDESSEPVQAGLSFQQIIQQNKDAKRLYDEHCASITDHPASKEATTLSQAILQGKWTVRQVTDAFLVKAALAQQVLGCFTEIYFDAARERADELDATYAKATTKDAAHLGSLFGVPVSIKAHLGLQGFGSDRGFVFDVLDSATTDRLISQEERSGKTPASTIALLRKQGQHTLTATGHMVSTLLSEGAVVLGKTTMPQGIMHLDTRSNLHGQTLNPINIHLSPGGSSGGEAASVASGATLAGLGTDIGGSVRQPAACVGLFGIRPTCGRVTTSGARATMLGNEGVMGTAGPFARSMRDLEVLTQVTIKQSYQVDPYMCPPLPWRGVQMPKSRIRIGVMLDDGYVQPITPIRRAMHHFAEKLKNTSQAAHGVEVVFVDPKDFGERAWNLVRQLYFMDNGHLLGALARMTGEPLTKLSKYILDPPHVQERSGADTWLLNYTREAFKREFWQTMFVQNKLDALICPASALCAPRPQHIHYWGYTSLFNLTDLPGITFPIEGFEANASVDEKYEQSQQGKCKSSYGEMDQSVKQEYEQNRNVFERAPVGLQIIGHRFCEEELFGILRVVLSSLV